VDLFLRRYGAAFLSASPIYLSDVLSIGNAYDKEEIPLGNTLSFDVSQTYPVSQPSQRGEVL
jgi:hypothetical protein